MTMIANNSGLYVLNSRGGESTKPSGHVTIDGESYPYININGKSWTMTNFHSENYDFKIAGGDAEQYPKDKYGLLYSAITAQNITLPDGWRLPYISDLIQMNYISKEGGWKEFFENRIKFNHQCTPIWNYGSYETVPSENYWVQYENGTFCHTWVAVNNFLTMANGYYQRSGALCYATDDSSTISNNLYMSLRFCKPDYGPSVRIGSRDYKTCNLGGRLWLAENLDYKFTGCSIGPSGQPTTPSAWYQDNNETLWGIDGTNHCGLLYNQAARDYLNNHPEILPDGWHIPSTTEWDDMVDAMGGSSAAGGKLKANNNSILSGWAGTDTDFASVYPGGYRGYDGIFFHGENDGANFWCSTNNWRYLSVNSTSVGTASGNLNLGFSIRLCKTV